MSRRDDIRAYRAIDRTCPHCGAAPAFPPCAAWSDGGPCRTCLAAELGPGSWGLCRRCKSSFPLRAHKTATVRRAAPKRRANPSRKRPSTTVQTLIFDSAQFTIRQAKSWARAHGFSWRVPDVTAKSVRLRQIEPDLFKRSSFRTITLTGGIKAVVGRLK